MALRSLLISLAVLLTPALALADAAPFDLAGPTLSVAVTHQHVTLPISEVPNLTAGDQLSIKAELPSGQSVHYLLVAAFLRGATNPPPATWFHRAETWGKNADAGLTITVPPGAQQTLLFLAPQTGGDYDTLVSAVRGRPGAFVRASQDLNQASLDRARLDAFLTALRKQSSTDDPDRLKTISPLLARSLNIKLNTDCFQKMAELQPACLMQGRDALVLNDGHSASLVEALTSGGATDLATALSATPQAGFGYYSPYIGAVTDIARILESFRTAQYQYIPAIATVQGDRILLLVNTPPSFHNPLSVLVSALPAVGPPQAPPLEPVDPKAAFCAVRPDLILPVQGAPLAYATHYAHDMVVRLNTTDGKSVDLPALADAEKGGYVVNTAGLKPAMVSDAVQGSLRGLWGFQPFEGPSFNLEVAHADKLGKLPPDQQSLVAGRDDVVVLEGQPASCVDAVELRSASGETQAVEWKAADSGKLSVTVPLANAKPGSMALLIKAYGVSDPAVIPIKAFAQASHLEGFTFHAGDRTGMLKGNRLDEVTGLTMGGITFNPSSLKSSVGGDELVLTAAPADDLSKFPAGDSFSAKVAMKDKRQLNLKVLVGPSRPRVALIAKSSQTSSQKPGIVIQLTGANELAHGEQLTFSVHAEDPASFSGSESIEVATEDGAASTVLTPKSGLTLEDSKVAVATLDTGEAFGPSGFGPLQFRIVEGGAPGEWQPLATLVRLPQLHELRCHGGPAHACELSGTGLFLIGEVSSEASFEHATKVPEGFPGNVMSVPHPSGGRLYMKLRDDPEVINRAAFPDVHKGSAGAPTL